MGFTSSRDHRSRDEAKNWFSNAPCRYWKDIIHNLPLPPLPEQHRLVSIIKEQLAAVDQARAAAQSRLDAIKALPAAYLRQVFPTSVQQLPSGWKWKKLKDISTKIDYGYTASADYKISEPKFLRITDIQDGKVNWDIVPGCKITDAYEVANKLEDGDIVFARTGATTGKSYLITDPPAYQSLHPI